MKKVVDLLKGKTSEYIIRTFGESAAELLCRQNPSRYVMPEDVLLTIDMLPEDVKLIKDAVAFNNIDELPLLPDVRKEDIVGLEFIDEPVNEEPVFKPHSGKIVKKVIEPQKETLTEFLSGLTLPQLKKYADNHSIGIKGLTTKKAILNKLEQQ